jgi:hypothetical protein
MRRHTHLLVAVAEERRQPQVLPVQHYHLLIFAAPRVPASPTQPQSGNGSDLLGGWSWIAGAMPALRRCSSTR